MAFQPQNCCLFSPTIGCFYFRGGIHYQPFNYLLMRLILCLFFSLALGLVSGQPLTSPESFLGYRIGTHFTRHHQVMDYYKLVASQQPNRVKLANYGTTNEGRPLMLAFIGSAENLQRLESIRQNNLALVSGKQNAKSADMPVIVWLSYNVHGNESSSTEASLLTLYQLANPENQSVNNWLKNTLIIMDPCINPDGRDRYVNWYNSVAGDQYNPDPAVREHAEPWPGGRVNHYYFDLNRDWAWQTQAETRQRMKMYNQWMPQVHVDFHEQGINGPYYFAPAAAPYHEAITQWQRDFQLQIGKNNAGYFDKNGWLFYTKERYDLLYPSYGDTYPIYNGAIGMTYEQAGGGRAGLGILKGDMDTLTLVDRAQHHYTTGISTIEVSAANQGKLLKEFQQFFDDARSGKGADYKTYVLTCSDENKLNALKELLQLNQINFGTLSNTSWKGYQYFSGKEEAFVNEGYHIAVSGTQTRSVLARVLLEPKTVVTDSNTYDITAWSLPYVYGIKAYGVKEKLDIKETPLEVKAITTANAQYGLLIPYSSFQSSKVLAALLKQNIKVRFAEKPFTYQNKQYDRGTLIVIKTGNPENWNQLTQKICQQLQVQPEGVETGFMDKGIDFGSPDVKAVLPQLKVAMLTGDQTSSLSSGEIWHYFERQLGYPLSLINATDLSRTSLKNYQVLILPDGNYRAISDKASTEKLKEFVRSGGKIIALKNALGYMAAGDWGLQIKNDKTTDKNEYAALKKYADAEPESLSGSVPGAIYRVELDNTHPLAFGYPNFYYTLKQDGPQYDFLKEGWNVGVLKKDGYQAGFVGVQMKNKLKDVLSIGVQEVGAGQVIYFAEDPLFRNFWENGKMLFANAVFLSGR